jgi:pyroglutamyl-peptidase
MKILVTGFPRYDAFKTNSSQMLIESMRAKPAAALRKYRRRVVYAIVDFDNRSAAAQQRTMVKSLQKLLATHQPDACIFCGQMPGRGEIRIEKLAINVFKGKIINVGGPAAYWATLPGADALPKRLRKRGIPAALSFHAGVHLCNHILYSGLHYAATRGIRMPCSFVHIPLTAEQAVKMGDGHPFMPLAMSREALAIIMAHTFQAIDQGGHRPRP